MMPSDNLHTSSHGIRIARNAMLLYARMLVLLVVGLFTSRIVLSALGVEDFGIYTAVAGVVVLFNVLTTAVSSAISRYMAFELGRGDFQRLKRVFVASRMVQVLLCLLLVVLTQTVGLWFVNTRMNLPPDRLEAARWVLECAMGLMVVNLLAVPYNALIITREKMGVFAGVSILEGLLKLLVAYLLYLSAGDKLIVYALLMLGVALIVRSIYVVYCHRYYAESRGSLFERDALDRGLLREMFSFAGWNTLGTSAFLLNTQGVNILQNIFFGVLVNAGRGIANQVEGIFKQFASNIMLAFNPQITRSYAAEDKDFCFALVFRASKFTSLVLLLLAIPIGLETETLLRLWLGQVPDYSVLFVRLTLLCTWIDMTSNALYQLVLATGKVKKYALLTASVSLLVFPVSWLFFHWGFPPETSYVVFAIVYGFVFLMKIGLARSLAAFPAKRYAGLLLRLVLVALPAFFVARWVGTLCTGTLWRLVAVTLTSTVLLVFLSFCLVLTPGERVYVVKKISRK
ncbi:MAG: lipopolysaccharide biosynthesis protein [Bacteroidales bacterium]|nr:lipopolysaccharide biosynthesis protein [Bacteroidales bacterium]